HHGALEHLRRGGDSEKINLGNGQGYSVMEVIEAARQVTGKEIKVVFEAPRAGDPSRLISNSAKANKVLGWKPQYPQLTEIIRTAWEWHSSHPNGYQN
ncbi:MAG TPA: UDP-glucose 4-epimerase GalE, partial [Blastocatellia bacterium]|nr:UDP-glucose 4-epimerase GalE [Blastocatellia bacterium]